MNRNEAKRSAPGGAPGARARRLAVRRAVLLAGLALVACGAPDPREPAFPPWLASPPGGATPELAEYQAAEGRVFGVAFHRSPQAVEAVVAHYSRRLDRDDWRIQLGQFDGPNGTGAILTAEHRTKPHGFHLTVSPAPEGSELVYNFTDEY